MVLIRVCLFTACAMSTACAFGQSVQLPTFNVTTVNTTVSVPDRGAVMLGGIDRSRSGSVSRGVPLLGKIPGVSPLFKNRGIGSETSSSRIWATARIISLEEEEELQVGRVLAERRRTGGATPIEASPLDRQAEFLSRNIEQRQSEPVADAPAAKLPSVKEIRRRNELAQQQRSSESVLFFEKGQAAEAAGKRGAAVVYYQMAARRADGEYQSQILARLDALTGAPAARIATRD